MTIADQMPRTPLMRGAHRTIAAAIVALCAIWMFLTAGPAAAQEYKIRAGDTLQVEVLEDPSLNRTLLVLPDGTISFPLAGSVAASGRTVSQVQSALTSGLSGNFAAAPTVTVSVASLAQRMSAVRDERPGLTIGDFNTADFEPAWERYENAAAPWKRLDCAVSGPGPARTRGTWPLGRVWAPVALDHAMGCPVLAGSAALVRTFGIPGSDHRGLVVDVPTGLTAS